MDPFSIAAVGLIGYGVYRYTKRGKAHEQWRAVLDEAAERLGAQASAGSRFDAPQLRATVAGVRVTVTVKEAYDSADKGVVVCEARLANGLEKVRLYFGWDIGKVKTEVEHIKPVNVPHAFGLTGQLNLRADDPDLGRDFFEHALNDVADVRREASAHGMEILVRGGTLRMAVHGIEQSAWLIERSVTATARLLRGVEYYCGASDSKPARGPNRPASQRTTGGNVERTMGPDDGTTEGAAHGTPECTLCSEHRKPDQSWIRCARCESPYHRDCWVQATGCLAEGCAETRATPW